MPHKLNPDYIRQIIAKDELRGEEVLYLTNFLFNVSMSNDSLMVDGKWVDSTAADRHSQDRFNYRGWTKIGKLYCRKCWASLIGVPREIIRRNWCESCSGQLYPEDDAWLDKRGFELYREQVTQFMGLAVRKGPQLMEGRENLSPNGRTREGYHKDHIYSVRDAFENGIPPFVVSAPPNIRMIEGKPNLSKGRKSDCTLEEMLAKYDAFLQVHPEWPGTAQQFYLRQETWVRTAYRVRLLRHDAVVREFGGIDTTTAKVALSRCASVLRSGRLAV